MGDSMCHLLSITVRLLQLGLQMLDDPILILYLEVLLVQLDLHLSQLLD
jgi:hypothetical protein